MVSRADRSAFANWWWTIDKVMLFGLIALLFVGFILSFAASPPVAEKIGLGRYHFVQRHAFFLVPALIAMIGLSFLNPKWIRRFAALLFVAALGMLLFTLFAGEEIKGSRRWITIASFSLQPSEFVKPALIVLVAWLFAENSRRADVPGVVIALVLLAMVDVLLILQPDFGQTVLTTASWCAVAFMAGMPWLWIGILGGVSLGGVFAAYVFIPNVTGRIDRFLDPSSGDTFQVDKSMESFLSGGWLGRGPGEGVVKRNLPDAHTDFVFAVVGEEFGVAICLVIVLGFTLLVLRGLFLATRQENSFVRLAIAGLIIQFGVQAVINMSVSLQLAPAKGMTLPFISYGGSSLIAIAVAMGMMLGLSRKRPESARHIWAPSQAYGSAA